MLMDPLVITKAEFLARGTIRMSSWRTLSEAVGVDVRPLGTMDI